MMMVDLNESYGGWVVVGASGKYKDRSELRDNRKELELEQLNK